MKKSHTTQFQDLYTKHADSVFRYCLYKTSDRNSALDITQEVFVKIWDFITNDGIFENEKAFVFSVASRKIIDLYRSKKVTVSLDTLRDEYGFDVQDDHKDIGIMQDGKLALSKIKELEPDYREVLLLKYVEGFGIKEIAEILDQKENAISVRIHRGIEKLKKIYK